MKCKKELLTILILGLFLNLQAQKVIPASGGEVTGSGGTVSYTVGQVVYATKIDTSGNSIAEGVQQPIEISEVIGIEETESIELICVAYPNPVVDNLKLKIDASTSFTILSLNYQLYDINGKLLESKKLKSNETFISMNKYVSAIYFLTVYENQNEIKTFKIIKY